MDVYMRTSTSMLFLHLYKLWANPLVIEKPTVAMAANSCTKVPVPTWLGARAGFILHHSLKSVTWFTSDALLNQGLVSRIARVPTKPIPKYAVS
jgi:hypothetical protein